MLGLRTIFNKRNYQSSCVTDRTNLYDLGFPIESGKNQQRFRLDKILTA